MDLIRRGGGTVADPIPSYRLIDCHANAHAQDLAAVPRHLSVCMH